jgi:uncharacterized protein (TIGR02646 family)
VRYIDGDDVRLRVLPEWRAKAEEAAGDLAVANEEERKRLLEKFAPIWRDVKAVLLAASSEKCWYCETRQDRAECDVEHFRPKARVHGLVHPGYYWLATVLTNLRVSCQFCNRVGSDRTRSEAGGKGDQFPLIDEAGRSYQPSDPIEREQPVLLDPTDVGDPQLLWVDDDGRVAPNPTLAPMGSMARDRVEASIVLLNLNEERLREARLAIRLEVGRAERLASESSSDEVWKDRVRWLVNRARGTAEYSLSVRCLLRALDVDRSSVAHMVLEQT